MIADYMKLIYKYDRKDFFGTRVWTEDFTYVRPDTVRKAFAAFKKDYSSSIEIDDLYFKSITIYWDSCSDHDNEIVTIRFYDSANSYSTEKMSFTKAKKLISDYMKEEAA